MCIDGNMCVGGGRREVAGTGVGVDTACGAEAGEIEGVEEDAGN